MATWTVTRDKLLTRDEILMVLADLKRKSRRSENTRMNLVLFRLATCCGLRASELCGLTLDNVRVGSGSPKIYVPKTIAKGGKPRVVPLTFDQGTLDDLREWKARREQQAQLAATYLSVPAPAAGSTAATLASGSRLAAAALAASGKAK